MNGKTLMCVFVMAIVINGCDKESKNSESLTTAPEQEVRSEDVKIFSMQKVIFERQTLEITEVSLRRPDDAPCVRPNCWLQSLFEIRIGTEARLIRFVSKHGQIVATEPQPSQLEAWRAEFDQGAKEAEARKETSREIRSMNIDFNDIEEVLDLEFYYAVSKCREAKDREYVLAYGTQMLGNFALEFGSHFDITRLGKSQLVVEFDRNSHKFLSLSASEKQEFGAFNSSYYFQPSVIIGHNPDVRQVPRTVNLPRFVPAYRRFLSSCNEYYKWFKSLPALDEKDSLAIFKAGFLPAFDSKLEDSKEFKARLNQMVRLSDTDKDRKFSSHREVSEVLDGPFFDRRIYPGSLNPADPLWLQIQKNKLTKDLK